MKHDQVDRYTVLMSAIKHGTSCFKLLTASSVRSKYFDGNSDLNFYTMCDKIPINISSHYGGNVSDNTNDALKEQESTFGTVMNEMKQKLSNSNVIFGVDRNVIYFGVPFHIDNLAVTHASIAAFGETEKENHL